MSGSGIFVFELQTQEREHSTKLRSLSGSLALGGKARPGASTFSVRPLWGIGLYAGCRPDAEVRRVSIAVAGKAAQLRNLPDRQFVLLGQSGP